MKFGSMNEKLGRVPEAASFSNSANGTKFVSVAFLVNHFLTGLFTTRPDEVAAVQNDLFMNVCDGTSQNQWSNTPNSRAIPFSTGTCSGVYPVMMSAYSS